MEDNHEKHFNDHVLVNPLFYIYSFSIHGKLIDNMPSLDISGRDCEIYGHIGCVDSLGNMFFLFQRNASNPDFVTVGDTLSIDINYVFHLPDITLDVMLMDRAQNNLVVSKGTITLDGSTFVHTQYRDLLIEGEGGYYTTLRYSFFQYGVLATVSVLYFSKDDYDLLPVHKYVIDEDVSDDDIDSFESCDSYDSNNYDYGNYGNCLAANLFGTVVARSNITLPTNSNGRDNYSTFLFRKSREQSVMVKSGDFLELSRSVVAVPAHSKLNIDVNFSHHDSQLSFASDHVEFKPWHEQQFKKDVRGENGNIRVLVKWGHTYERIYQSRNLKQSTECVLSPKRQMYPEVLGNGQKKPKLLLDQQSPAALCGGSIPLVPKNVRLLPPMQLVEVFSVVVHSKDFEPFDFCGTVSALDGLGNAPLFRNDETCPQNCPASGTLLSLKTPRCFSGMDDFGVYVDLKDVGGLVVSRGSATWGLLSRFEPWYDRHLCSVTRGDRGFAAVHYTCFSNGVEAVVEVTLFNEGKPARVYGEIVARYGTHEYMTSYEEKYFQNVLFHRGFEDDPPEQACGSRVQLLKPVISAPRNSSLIFIADLTVSPIPVKDVHSGRANTLRNRLELKADSHESSPDVVERELSYGRIGGNNCYIDVSVEWRNRFGAPWHRPGFRYALQEN